MSFTQESELDRKYFLHHGVQAMIAVIVMGVVLLFIFLLVKIGQKWAIKRRGQATLRLFTRLPYSDIELSGRDTICRICLSDFESTDNIYILPPCTHLYHSECISTWMRSQIICSTCRRNYGNIYTSWIGCLTIFIFFHALTCIIMSAFQVGCAAKLRAQPVVAIMAISIRRGSAKWATKRRGQATLRLFPRLPYSGIELGDRDTTCRICLSDFKSTDDNIYILPCTHLYHSECISTWMRRQITCPTCRRNYGNIYTSWITCLV
ncbi:hypothetical protein H5410_043679 [Solanum commersonii]|uniref:RING-type E3 ubiquitin transferase n=1 Tax=Solanum commersonii TaxID=4109 RepID=A0A9J5XZ32_SOLCO|nr:hypothetical protein H5410_043679 [Solanum commersonii]